MGRNPNCSKGMNRNASSRCFKDTAAFHVSEAGLRDGKDSHKTRPMTTSESILLIFICI